MKLSGYYFYMNTNIWRNFQICIIVPLNRVVFSFKIYFFFSFYSDFNLEATVVKTDKIRGLKQLFTPFFSKLEKTFFKNN